MISEDKGPTIVDTVYPFTYQYLAMGGIKSRGSASFLGKDVDPYLLDLGAYRFSIGKGDIGMEIYRAVSVGIERIHHLHVCHAIKERIWRRKSPA